MTLLAVFILGLIGGAGVGLWMLHVQREGLGRLIAEMQREIQVHAGATEWHARRADGLAAMLDEIRARDTQTTPPTTVTSTPAEAPLPPEIERELSAIEDEEGRDELRQLVRLALQQNPTAPTEHIISEVFGG
jgi:hypothetical protein